MQLAGIILASALLAGCFNPNPETEAARQYNDMINALWIAVITSIVAPTIAAIVAWFTRQDVKQLSRKVDVQQAELLNKTDAQTVKVVGEVKDAARAAARTAAEVAVEKARDDGRRDRRFDDPRQEQQ